MTARRYHSGGFIPAPPDGVPVMLSPDCVLVTRAQLDTLGADALLAIAGEHATVHLQEDGMDDEALARDIDRRFAYHPATDRTGPLHESIRETYRQLAHHVRETVPAGHEQDLALDALRVSMMWANAGIACGTD